MNPSIRVLGIEGFCYSLATWILNLLCKGGQLLDRGGIPLYCKRSLILEKLLHVPYVSIVRLWQVPQKKTFQNVAAWIRSEAAALIPEQSQKIILDCQMSNTHN